MMDEQGLLPPAPAKRRRRHTPAFKAMVVKATFESGNSVAGVAQRYDLNDNLVHKWRRQHRAETGATTEDFVRLPLLPAVPAVAAQEPDHSATIRVEVPGALGTVTVHWPLARAEALANWLKALQT